MTDYSRFTLTELNTILESLEEEYNFYSDNPRLYFEFSMREVHAEFKRIRKEILAVEMAIIDIEYAPRYGSQESEDGHSFFTNAIQQHAANLEAAGYFEDDDNIHSDPNYTETINIVAVDVDSIPSLPAGDGDGDWLTDWYLGLPEIDPDPDHDHDRDLTWLDDWVDSLNPNPITRLFDSFFSYLNWLLLLLFGRQWFYGTIKP